MTDAEIEALYLRHRRPFIAWAAKQFGLAQEDALDVYQEAIIAFVRNVRAGRYDPAASEPSTYLFAIGRNQALNALRRRKGRDARNVSDLRIAHSPESEQRHDEEHNAHLIAGGMAALSEKEREILRLYYSEERSMTEIAEAMGYHNADVAKKMKYVAFRKIAALITKTVAPQRPAHVE